MIIPLNQFLQSAAAHQPDAARQGGGRTEEFRAGAGRGDGHPARAAPRPPGRGRRLLHRHGGQLHLAVAEHQRGVLRGVRDGQFDLGRGGRHRHHERDAGVASPSGRRRSASGARWAPRSGISAKQFLTESVMQCLIGGLVGVSAGFASRSRCGPSRRFPASVQTWVAISGWC